MQREQGDSGNTLLKKKIERRGTCAIQLAKYITTLKKKPYKKGEGQ